MKHPTAQPGIFPEERLHHLVQAACVDTDTKAAWQAYSQALGDDFPNEGELRIFPLIADRLGENIDDQPLAKYLRSTRRWARMQSMVNRQLSEQIGQLFKAENIPLMWTKGTALVAHTDQRPELRPSTDIDALVHWEDVERIQALGKAQGWTPHLEPQINHSRARYANTEISFDIGARGELDLQWLPRLPFAYDTEIQRWLWQDQGLATDASGIPYTSSTWLIIEIIEHGLNANAVHPIRWVVDAVRLLEWRHESVDWQAIIEILKRNKLHHSFHIGLQTIAQYSEYIPDSVLEALGNIRVSYLDREEFRARITATDISQGYLTLRALNRLRREPSRIYYKAPPSPIKRRINLSSRTRLAIAGRNIYTRLLFPLWYL